MTSKGKKEQGQALVEFVLIFPVLLLIMMACIEFGWYFAARYSLGQYSREIGYNLNAPFTLVWKHESASRDWIDASSGRKPSWLSEQEKKRWSFDDYDGWYAFSNPTGSQIIGSNYYYGGFDNETAFKNRLNLIQTVLDTDELTYQLYGGWYIKAEAIDMPAGGGSGWKQVRNAERSEYYYADVTVETTYKYRPLTFVGGMIFCKPGDDFTLIHNSSKYTYALSPGLRS